MSGLHVDLHIDHIGLSRIVLYRRASAPVRARKTAPRRAILSS